MFALVFLSIFFMILDQRSVYFHRAQTYLSVVSVPFQYAVNGPIQLIEWISNSLTTDQQILEENAKLRAQQLLLQAKLQRMIAVENENSQLRALLQSSPHVGGKFTVAQLLAVNMDPFVQKVILDKGTDEKIYIGQPVLDAYGVMGQVVKLGLKTSEVLLLTDPQSAISVQDSRNGVRAIVAGNGNNKLQLVNVPDSTDVQVGDLMVTSGLDERFPQGYPVGTVKQVNRDPEFRFASVTLEPSAHIDRSRMVLLVWPVIEKPPVQTVQNNPQQKPTTTTTTNTSQQPKPSERIQPGATDHE